MDLVALLACEGHTEHMHLWTLSRERTNMSHHLLYLVVAECDRAHLEEGDLGNVRADGCQEGLAVGPCNMQDVNLIREILHRNVLSTLCSAVTHRSECAI